MELMKSFQQKQDVTTVLVGVGAALTATWLYRRWSYNSRYRLPAGPPGSWIIGNYDLLCENKQGHLSLTDLRSSHGDMCRLQMGIYDSVLLNSYDLVKEALVDKGEMFIDRPNLFVLKLLRGTSAKGILNSNGPLWQQMRRFTIRALRDLGMGKKKMEDLIQQEAEILVNHLDKHAGSEVDVSAFISSAVSNIICHLIFNIHYEYDDEELKSLIESLAGMFQQGGLVNMREMFVPYLLPTMIFKRSQLARVLKHVKKLFQHINKTIDDHYENYDPANMRDYIDMFIRSDKTASGEGVEWSKDNLLTCIFDLFIAGAETTNTTLSWGILYLMRYPDVQKKCRDEILQVVGQQLPAYSDKKNMPYVEATILEIQRLASIAAILMREATQDVEFHGYTIPKGLLIFTNLYAANTDPKYFPDPQKFDPQRWLDKDGLFSAKIPPINFGAGPHVCLGETLAKYELFLFFTSMIQRFEFSMVDEAHPPSVVGQLGMTLTPQPYKVIMKHV